MHLDSRPTALVASQPRQQVSVLELCNQHLDWVLENRSKSLYDSRKSILTAWCNFDVEDASLTGCGKLVGELAADSLSRRHLEAYLRHVRTVPSKKTRRPIGEAAQRHIVVAVKAAWNWAADCEADGGGGLIAEACRPFAKVPRPFVSMKDLTEADLLTDAEIAKLFAFATADTERIRGENGKYRARKRHEWRTGDDNPYSVFEDMLRVYYATGARTGELCRINVRDFHWRTSQLTLGKHKRTKTQQATSLRVIQLGADAYEIVAKHCKGKHADQPVFVQHSGERWTTDWVGSRFAEVRSLAGVRGHITVYSFRDLYISELLREGIEPFEVSKMAGTSLKEIERTYGHFYNAKLAAAQAKLDAARAARGGERLKVVSID